MTAKWVQGYSPDLLCGRLEEIKSLDSSGKASFKGFDFTSNVAVLNSMVFLDNSIPQVEKKRIITKAAFNSAGFGVITPDSLLSEIGKLEKQYLRETPKKYVLVTSLSIGRFIKVRRQSMNGCTLTFHTDIPKVFREEVAKIERQASYSICGELPRNYLIAKIAVTGRSTFEAADRAIDAIDLFRGFWNLFYNRRQFIRISSGRREPVNKIVLGPLHTLHFPTAKLASESWWYESDYTGPINTLDPLKEIDAFYEFLRRIRKLLRKSPFKMFLESAIIRYTRALDLRDWNNAFLNLWSLLEKLTNTGENDTHKVTVRRTSFFYKDREYVKHILTHLREYRNRAVHMGSGNEDIETLMFQLKNFIETALEFLVANKFDLKNLDEVAQFLDLSHEKITLTNRIQLLRSALKYTQK